MRENVGRSDRIVRSIVGPALLLYGYRRFGHIERRAAGVASLLSGFALVETALTRVCPLNRLLGLNTRTAAMRRRDRFARLGG